MHAEIFSLVWLDDFAETVIKDPRQTEQKLRSIIKDLRKFQDVEQCRKYIRDKSTDDRLVLVVNGSLGQKMIPSIHALRQVMSIYVYCKCKENNKLWTSAFNKVRALVG